MAIVSENKTEVLPRYGLYSTYTEIFFASRFSDGIGIADGEGYFCPRNRRKTRKEPRKDYREVANG